MVLQKTLRVNRHVPSVAPSVRSMYSPAHSIIELSRNPKPRNGILKYPGVSMIILLMDSKGGLQPHYDGFIVKR